MSFGHMIASALLHGVVYDAIYKAMRHLSLPQAVLVAGIVIALVWAWKRTRRRQGGHRKN